MVVSSACMTTARMTQAVIAGRLIGKLAAAPSAMAGLRGAEPSGQEGRQTPFMAGIDVDLDAHSNPQRRLAGLVVDADAHRNALHHLDPVAAGILGRQQREARRRSRADAVDGAGPSLARISVDLDRHLLAGPDIGQFGFLWTGLDPDVIGRDDVEAGRRRREVLT